MLVTCIPFQLDGIKKKIGTRKTHLLRKNKMNFVLRKLHFILDALNAYAVATIFTIDNSSKDFIAGRENCGQILKCAIIPQQIASHNNMYDVSFC